jgi:hypothetical protein
MFLGDSLDGKTPIAGNRLGGGDVQDAMRLPNPLGTAIATP